MRIILRRDGDEDSMLSEDIMLRRIEHSEGGQEGVDFSVMREVDILSKVKPADSPAVYCRCCMPLFVASRGYCGPAVALGLPLFAVAFASCAMVDIRHALTYVCLCLLLSDVVAAGRCCVLLLSMACCWLPSFATVCHRLPLVGSAADGMRGWNISSHHHVIMSSCHHAIISFCGG